MSIHCVIVSPDKIVYDGNADIVLLPAKQGQIGVMEHHARLFTELESGLITVKNGNEKTIFTVTSGFVQIDGEEVRVLAEASENINDIDIQRAEAAKERAQEALKKANGKESPEFMRAAMKIRIEQMRIAAGKRAGKG